MLRGHLARLYRLCGLCPQLLVRDPRVRDPRGVTTPVLVVWVGRKLVAVLRLLLTPLLLSYPLFGVGPLLSCARFGLVPLLSCARFGLGPLFFCTR